MDQLINKTAIVTGAASGIGLGITRALIAEGVNVAMLDVERDGLQNAAANLDSRTVSIQHYVVDVTDRTRMLETANNVQRDFGNVHILCNNAGIASGGAIHELAYADWDRCLGINLMGVVNGLQCFLPLMTSHEEEGHIVNTASILGMATMPGQAAYAASKFAVVGLSEVARKDLAPKKIGVSVLCPGLIATNIIKSLANQSDTSDGRQPAIDLDEVHQMYQKEGLSADIVGQQVVTGIKRNKPYIFTHANLAAMVEHRNQEVMAGFDGSEAEEVPEFSFDAPDR